MIKIDKKYSAVILDFEKTLVGLNINWDFLRKKNAEIFKKYGFAIDYRLLRPIFEETANQLKYLESLDCSRGEIPQILKELIEAQKNYEQKHLDLVVLYPDVKKFLDYIKDEGLKVAVLTNNSSSTVRKVFLKFNVSFNNPIIGREDVKYPKPDAEGIIKLLKVLDVDGEDCIFIGDTDFDINIAKKMKNLAIFLKRNENQKLFNSKPDKIITSLSEIIFV